MVVAGFVAPYLLDTTTRFVQAAATLPDVKLALITCEPADRLPPGLRDSLAGHWRIEDGLDAGQIAGAVRGLGGQLGPVQRLLAVLEQLQVPLAQVREDLGIPGMDVVTAGNFRDKAQMKTVLRAAGVPCARHRLARSAADAADFARLAGFPLVVKPPAGAGAKSTFRLDDHHDLATWLQVSPPSPERPALIEEFLTGEEGSYDSVMVDGQVVQQTRPFRDKERMKQLLDAAGLRTPRHVAAGTVADVWAAADQIGFPLIVKPIDGAGSADTYRADSVAELDTILPSLRHVPQVSVEEFIDGEEFTYDTICAGGRVLVENICQYHPRPLLTKMHEWISPITMALRDLDEPGLQAGRELGGAVLRVLGFRDGFTHMEWYRKADGMVIVRHLELPKALEIAQRFAAELHLFAG